MWCLTREGTPQIAANCWPRLLDRVNGAGLSPHSTVEKFSIFNSTSSLIPDADLFYCKFYQFIKFQIGFQFGLIIHVVSHKWLKSPYLFNGFNTKMKFALIDDDSRS